MDHSDSTKKTMKTQTVKISDIIRPLQSVVDEDKIEYLMNSIIQEGQREPIDLLENNGKLYGFNGCHRYTAHKRLGYETIQARVRSVDDKTLQLHLR